jgi:hypothetical protein
VRTARWKYGVVAPDKEGSVHPGSEKYVESYLYDLRADPYELTNLIGYQSHRRVSEVMWERLNRRMVAAGEEIAVIEPAPSRPAGQRIVTEAEALS